MNPSKTKALENKTSVKETHVPTEAMWSSQSDLEFGDSLVWTPLRMKSFFTLSKNSCRKNSTKKSR